MIKSKVPCFSYFEKPISNTIPDRSVTLEEVAKLIKTETVKKTIEEFRRSTDTKKQSAIKRFQLPFFTVGGIFTERNQKGLKEKSGYLVLDFDNLGDPAEVKTILSKDSILDFQLIFVSPSGTGIKAITSYDHNSIDHSKLYHLISLYLIDQYNLEADPNCKDITRSCLLSYDPDLYFNPIEEVAVTKEVFQRLENKYLPIPKPSVKPVAVIENISNINALTFKKVELLVTYLEENCIDLTEAYNNWLKLGFAFASLGENGRTLFHRISNMYARYQFEEADKLFSDCITKSDGRTGIATFFYLCNQYGVNIPSDSSLQISSTITDLKGLIESVTINLKEKPPMERPLFEIQGKTAGTLGNFSAVTGAAKSKKTYFISLLASAMLSDEVASPFIKFFTSPSKRKVLLVDTEQSHGHVWNVADRVRILTGLNVEEEDLPFKTLALRRFDHKTRLAVLEEAIYTSTETGLVIIDGVRDLVSGINNEEEAALITNKLLKWSEELKIHITVVIHENKSNSKVRGHLGTEIVNKAETVISIEPQSATMSLVKPSFTRNQPWEPIAFEVDSFGLPKITEDFVSHESSRRSSPKDFSDEEHEEILNKVYQQKDSFSYSELYPVIKAVLKADGILIGDNKAKDFIRYYENLKYLTNISTSKRDSKYVRIKNE